MSKTYSDQMGKARVLVDGLNRNGQWAQEHSIDTRELDSISSLIDEGKRLNEEADALREKARQTAFEANVRLAEVKKKMMAWKRIVKQSVDSTEWIKYGVQDKR